LSVSLTTPHPVNFFVVLFFKKNVGKPAGFPYHPIPLGILWVD
jgi:hypothetical protein